MSDSEEYDDNQKGGKESSILKKLIGKAEKPQGRWKKPDRPGGTYWDLPEPTRDVEDKSGWESNGCYPLVNEPTDYQRQNFQYTTLAEGVSLGYDCFMPTGETYEFLPCAPHPWDKVIGFKKYRGTHRIMDLEGYPEEGHEAFVPYKLLLYKGRYNADPGYDDRHRFVYLAENKPKEPLVGDCFIRLEEIHKRMKGTATDYTEDCARYNKRQKVLRVLSPLSKSTKLQMAKAREEEKILKREGKWGLRFRCWTVDGKECAESERRLRNRLFNDVFPANDERDHLDVFKVWAELLRNSQGDKLGAKDFFGRYWDAVIPDAWLPAFQNGGFIIVLGEKWFQGSQLDYNNPTDRDDMRGKVSKGIERAVNAPRLKFKPPLEMNHIIFQCELDQHLGFAADWFDDGWRYLDGHPGELYQILVDKSVRQFLCIDTHKKPFWQEGYGYPQEPDAKRLNDDHLKKCRPHTMPTTTFIDTTLLNNPIKKRTPTQDRCVADAGYSANVAMSDAFPNIYPQPAVAKRKRVAEWLHRSAFSYGGHVDGKLNNSQTANNLVLGTPDTNTVMMRSEAFVKRLVMCSNNGKHAARVNTEIDYSTLEQSGRWMGGVDYRYTWLAANLKYRYYSIVGIVDNNEIIGHVDVTRNFFPLNRESCLLFQAILDKSLENLCWGWNCWDANRVVLDALLESTVVPGDQEEANKEELKEKLNQATGGSLNAEALEVVVQQNLA